MNVATENHRNPEKSACPLVTHVPTDKTINAVAVVPLIKKFN